MPWSYDQVSGELSDDLGLVGVGYSGFGEGKNNPDMQSVVGVGPIPQGRYVVGRAFDSKVTGPLSIPLYPESIDTMFGRSGFYMHGDSIEHPGEASHGCIVMAHSIRQKFEVSSDRLLIVYAKKPE